MEMVLYRNNSDDKVVTKDIVVLATLNGTLRKNCSMLDPVIEVEGISNALLAQLNYVKLSEFGRYYFVKNITYKGNLVEISMHVDVLSSWQTQLKALDAVVIRQENMTNAYLKDGIFRTYSNPKYSIVPFDGAFDTYQYILSVSG